MTCEVTLFFDKSLHQKYEKKNWVGVDGSKESKVGQLLKVKEAANLTLGTYISMCMYIHKIIAYNFKYEKGLSPQIFLLPQMKHSSQYSQTLLIPNL